MDDITIYMIKYNRLTFLVASKITKDELVMLIMKKGVDEFRRFIERSARVSFVNIPMNYIGE